MNKKTIGITCGVLGCLALLAIIVLVVIAVFVPGYFLRQAQENQPAAPAPGGEGLPGMDLSGMQTQAIDKLTSTVPLMPFLSASQKERLTAALGKLRSRAAGNELPMATFQAALRAWGEMLQDGQVTDAEVAHFEQLVVQ